MSLSEQEAKNLVRALHKAHDAWSEAAGTRGYGKAADALNEAEAAVVTALMAAEGAQTHTDVEPVASYQARVNDWVVACFGEEVARDGRERNHRFLEEALELVQATGCTAGEAYQLVDYVFGRDIGDPGQEVGGVMNTLAALCTAHGLDLDSEAERELARVWTKVEAIRAKHASKPQHSPLPGSSPSLSPVRGAGESYEFVKMVGRLEHSADDGATTWDSEDDRATVDRLIAEAREIMSKASARLETPAHDGERPTPTP